jgi:hypothetical protein
MAYLKQLITEEMRETIRARLRVRVDALYPDPVCDITLLREADAVFDKLRTIFNLFGKSETFPEVKSAYEYAHWKAAVVRLADGSSPQIPDLSRVVEYTRLKHLEDAGEITPYTRRKLRALGFAHQLELLPPPAPEALQASA